VQFRRELTAIFEGCNAQAATSTWSHDEELNEMEEEESLVLSSGVVRFPRLFPLQMASLRYLNIYGVWAFSFTDLEGKFVKSYEKLLYC
jgi:hypothetical protein